MPTHFWGFTRPCDGLIAGGDGAIRTAVEAAEDDSEQGWKDLENLHVSTLA